MNTKINTRLCKAILITNIVGTMVGTAMISQSLVRKSEAVRTDTMTLQKHQNTNKELICGDALIFINGAIAISYAVKLQNKLLRRF